MKDNTQNSYYNLDYEKVFALSSHFFNNRYLLNEGYIRSLVEERVVDSEGNALPWFTYPAIDLCRERVKSDFSVFEFGCGYGTFWWSKYVKKVTIIEHNKEWFSSITPKFAANVRPIFRELKENGEYAHILKTILPIKYDVIIML